MIDRAATIKKFGYDSDKLSGGSSKRVVVVCEKCKKVRDVDKNAYRDLCRSCTRIGKHHSEATLLKMSESKRGEKHNNFGKHHSKETCRKMRDAHVGMSRSVETCQRVSATKQGISYDEWEAFAVDKPYCPAFNETCRESNREKYGRRCFICGLPEAENMTKTGKVRKLSVHHVDMNKNQGCDGYTWKLIPTCMHHHGMTHNPIWIDRIIYLLRSV